MVERRRVRLDRGAGRGRRLRPPARRDVLPWLLPRALHDLEARRRGAHRRGAGRRRAARRAGPARRRPRALGRVQRLVRAARQTVRADRPGRRTARPPATICVLSGDVHHTYISEATFPHPMASRVYQFTCSPLHNSIPLPMRGVFKAVLEPPRGTVHARTGAGSRESPPPSITGRRPPARTSAITSATLTFDGRAATFELLSVRYVGSTRP